MKISRATTSSLIWFSSSGVMGRPERSTCCFRASARSLGTALPLTMAMFCAATGKAIVPSMAAATRPDKSCFFIGNPRIGNEFAGDWPTGPLIRAVSESFNGDGVCAMVNKNLQRIIHKPMLRHLALAGEQGGGDAYAKLGAKAGAVRARVSFVLPAFVQHFELGWGQRFAQARGHGFGSDGNGRGGHG